MDWKIKKRGYRAEDISSDGNRFLIGNGYMGIRGTLEEYGKEQLAAVNLAGIYDKVGDGWREPLNAPNALYTYIKVDGEIYRLPEKEPLKHECVLDYRHGIMIRETTWRTPRGNVTVKSEKFADAERIHRIAMRYTVTADFHADMEIVTGIDGDVWDIHGPHYDKLELIEEKGILSIAAVTHEKAQRVSVSETGTWDFPSEVKIKKEEKGILRRIIFVTDCNVPYTLDKWIGIYTSNDCGAPEDLSYKEIISCLEEDYEEAKEAHKKSWEKRWQHSEVLIEGDCQAMEALNYSLYHLHCIAPRHKEGLSIPARGLSGQTYKGAVFWDTEMFMLDFFLYTEPAIAGSLMKYRIETLPGAREKAKQYGYSGAFYAWESQEGGYDACSDYNVTDVFTGRPMRTYFRDKQYHISAAVVYGIMRYTQITGDYSLLEEGGAQVVLECAEFYYSLLYKKAGEEKYEIHDCIGPDEYHERVNNNGYTNRMAKYTFENAVKTAELLTAGELGPYEDEAQSLHSLKERYADAAAKIYIPMPDENGIIEQFDGYGLLEDVSVEEVRARLLHEKEYWGGAYGVAAHTKVIKQADVITWLNLFPEDFPEEIMEKNWQYYEPRTEHGSSLSACMYAILACRLGMASRAYPFFLKSAAADLAGGGKEWAGLVYIGGTHPAAAGGAYMTAVKGFAGVYMEEGEIKVKPHLPAAWQKMRFRIHYMQKEYQIEITKDNAVIVPVETKPQPDI